MTLNKTRKKLKIATGGGKKNQIIIRQLKVGTWNLLGK